MSDEMIVNELVRMSMDLVISKGRPPEEAIRMALEQVFMSMASAVRHSSDLKYRFPMIFPMEMTLKSRQLHWNFQLIAKLKNPYADKEEK